MAKHMLLLCLIIVLVGCTQPVGNNTPTRKQDKNIILTPENSSATTMTPPVTEFKQLINSYQIVEVFDEGSGFHLLVKTSVDNIGTFNLTTGKIENEELLSDSVIVTPVISKNGLLLAYINSQQGEKALVIKNLNIKVRDISISLPKDAILARWIGTEKVAIWGSSPEWQCLNLLLIYDSQTAKTSYPKFPMSDLTKSDCIQLPLLSSNGTKMIYPWKIFDFQSGVATSGFPFMSNAPRTPPAYSLLGVDDKVSIAYASENELAYALNIPFTQITQLRQPNMILLPGLATKAGWWQPLTWWLDQTKLGVDLIDPQTDPLNDLASNHQPPTKFYFIDFDRHQIIDYNLDRGVFLENTLPQRFYEGFPSPTGKYFSWTIYDSSTGLPIGSKVLDVSSGRVISIPMIEILGWAVSGQQ